MTPQAMPLQPGAEQKIEKTTATTRRENFPVKVPVGTLRQTRDAVSEIATSRIRATDLALSLGSAALAGIGIAVLCSVQSQPGWLRWVCFSLLPIVAAISITTG
jgi:hypothetical protein